MAKKNKKNSDSDVVLKTSESNINTTMVNENGLNINELYNYPNNLIIDGNLASMNYAYKSDLTLFDAMVLEKACMFIRNKYEITAKVDDLYHEKFIYFNKLHDKISSKIEEMVVEYCEQNSLC